MIFLFIGIGEGFAQNTATNVYGIVTDSKGEPIHSVAVFVPYTSIGTTTNSKGEYKLPVSPRGTAVISFRHISFETLTKTIQTDGLSILRLDVKLELANLELEEVVKTASRTNWRLGYDKFSRYVLGDDYGRTCVLNNKQDLVFYYVGDRLIGKANKPLKITNNYLGYNITYYLDYFWWEEKYLMPDDTVPQVSFAFSGSTVYEDLINKMLARKSYWKRNRDYQFQGTQRHFMQCIFDGPDCVDSLKINQAWTSFSEYQDSHQLTSAVAYAKYHEMNKVFYWNPKTRQSSYINYSPIVEYEIGTCEIDSISTGFSKRFKLNIGLLIFFYRNDEGDQSDTRIVLCSADQYVEDEPILVSIDYYGNFVVSGGKISWEFLDSQTNLFSALPKDYIGRDFIE